MSTCLRPGFDRSFQPSLTCVFKHSPPHTTFCPHNSVLDHHHPAQQLQLWLAPPASGTPSQNFFLSSLFSGMVFLCLQDTSTGSLDPFTWHSVNDFVIWDKSPVSVSDVKGTTASAMLTHSLDETRSKLRLVVLPKQWCKKRDLLWLFAVSVSVFWCPLVLPYVLSSDC